MVSRTASALFWSACAFRVGELHLEDLEESPLPQLAGDPQEDPLLPYSPSR
jgi:hypothetical protein